MNKIVAVGLAVVATIALTAAPYAAAAPSSWSAPAVLGHLQTNTGYGASTVATNPNGASIAVWSALQGRQYRYLAATRAPGQAWSAPHVLAQHVQNGRIFADISASGRATAIWTLAIGSGSVHYATHVGSTWSASRVIAGSDGLNATSFAKAPNGYGVLAGTKEVKVNPSKPPLSVAFIRKLTPAGTWGPARQVSSRTLPTYDGRTHAGTGASDVHAAIDGAGSVVAAWGWSYFQDPSGAYTRLQRNSVGAGGKVGKVVDLKPTPQFRLGVESVQMSPSGRAAIVWEDDESTTAYVLVKASTGPWDSTSRDIHTLGIGDASTFVVNDTGLTQYWVTAAAAAGSTTLTLSSSTYGPTGWSPSVTLDTDTVAGSDEIQADGLLGASAGNVTYLLWGSQDVTKFLAKQRSDTTRVTTITSAGVSTQVYPLGNTGEAISAGGSHAAGLIGSDVAGAVAPDLTAITR